MKYKHTLIPDDHKQEYVINGVAYTVMSSFTSTKSKDSHSIKDCINRIILNDFAPLTGIPPSDKISTEYMSSTAGKED